MKFSVAVLLGAAALAASSTSLARVVSVGPGADCDTSSLQSAINILASSGDDAHIIRLQSGTVPVPSGVVVNNLRATNIFFSGGHARCADPLPTAGQISTVDAAGGGDGTAITILVDGRATAQEVFFDDVVVTGGSSETGPFANPEGGGIEARGHVHIRLREGTRVEGNASGRGAGVYLNGISETLRVMLTVEGGAEIALNDAISTGGGVYCHSAGMVELDNGQISGNTATEGGGVYLSNGCSFNTFVAQGAGFTGLVSNEADSGAAFFVNAIGAGSPIFIFGQANNPFQILGHVGNAVRAVSTSATVAPQLTFVNTIWAGNQDMLISAFRLGDPLGFDVVMGASGACSYSFFGTPGCAGVYQNGSDEWATLIDNREGMLFLNRVRFDDNTALFWLMRATVLDATGIIATNNLAADPNVASLFLVEETKLRFSTLVDNSVGVVSSDTNPDFTGSIFWRTGRAASASSNPIHNGCMIASDPSGLPGGVIVEDPQLEADFTPGPNSPALDVCSDFADNARDFFFNPRGVEQPSIPDLFGPYDLGAVERQQIITPPQDFMFSDGFESP